LFYDLLELLNWWPIYARRILFEREKALLDREKEIRERELNEEQRALEEKGRQGRR
jgi:hypothetical protein